MKENKFKVGDSVLLKGTIIVMESNDILFDSSLGRTYALEEDLLLFEESSDKSYEQGLEDGMVSLNRLYNLTLGERENIFGTTNSNNSIKDIIKNFTATEIHKKIESYKEQQSITVGDVVIVKNVVGHIKGVVVHVCNTNTFDVLTSVDGVYKYIPKKFIEKTGEHIDILKVLEGLN